MFAVVLCYGSVCRHNAFCEISFVLVDRSFSNFYMGQKKGWYCLGDYYSLTCFQTRGSKVPKWCCLFFECVFFIVYLLFYFFYEFLKKITFRKCWMESLPFLTWNGSKREISKSELFFIFRLFDFEKGTILI